MRLNPSFPNPFNGNITAQRLVAFFFCGLLLAIPLSTDAAEKCCRCKHPSVPTGEFCIQDTFDCDKLVQSGNKLFEQATCGEMAASIVASKCKKIPQGICLNDPVKAVGFTLDGLPKTPASSGNTQPDPKDSDIPSYTPLTPNLGIDIPGLQFTDAYVRGENLVIPYLAQYLSAVQKVLIGLGMIAAAIMIVYGGFLYMVSATGASVQSGKSIIIDALIGMVLLIGSYAILANINPQTVRPADLTVLLVERKLEILDKTTHQGLASQSAYYGGNDESATPAQVIETARSIAQKEGIDPCIVEAIVKTESSGKAGVIGHDESFNYVATGVTIPNSRTHFLRRRTFYSGKAFPPPAEFAIYPADCTPSKVSAATYQLCRTLSKDGPLNDDKLDPSKPWLGLDPDPKITHGFGLSQVTFSSASKCSNGSWGIMLSGTCFTPSDLLTVEGGVRGMLAHPAIKPGASAEAVFKAYIGRPNPGLLAKKMAAYQKCKGRNP